VSRVGVVPILLPQGVQVQAQPGSVEIKGPKGDLTVPFRAEFLKVDVSDGAVRVGRNSDDKPVRALHGLTRSLLANGVKGVSEGFSKRLELFGVGYRAEVQGSSLTLNIGYSHTVVYDAPKGVEIKVEDITGGAQARITVSGIDKQQVGQVAADIREKRKPEPYKGKGIRYEDEIIHWKAGKTAVG
jgi:large subunit ribosomal protein L6